MGGTSTQNATQSSTTAPWAPAQSSLTSILGSLNPLIGSSGLTSPQTTAIQQLTANGQAGNPYATSIGNTANTLLAGGGATNQAGNVNQNYLNYQAQTNPLASNTNYDPMSTPGLGTELSTIGSDVTNQVNGQFAAAGRSGSPSNSMALGRGIAAGEAPVIANQYNANVANQQGAAGALYAAGNTNAGILAGLQQQGLTNQVQGVQTANDALTAQNYGPNAVLTAQQYLQSIPTQNLGMLAQIGTGIAGLGSQSTGQSSGTSTESGAQQFAQIGSGAAGIGKLLFG